MAKLKAVVIGCGGRGTAHAEGYAACPEVEIAAVADPVPENAEKLAKRFDVPKVYKDYREMLKKHSPDLVSVCTWPETHREIVVTAAEGGARAIHAEKPMAPTWGEARTMHQACVDLGVQLTFCHQRRFSRHFVKARDLVRSGAIGELVRVEGYCSNLFDWGTHWFDMLHFFNDDEPAAWVMGQIDCSQPRSVFGVPVESAGLSYVKFKNGVTGMLVTGRDPVDGRANRIVGGEGMFLIGTTGTMEVGVQHGPALRVHHEGKPETPELGPSVPETVASVQDMVKCLETGQEPELSSFKALRATELIFGTYESSRIRGRVTVPLTIDDSPLITMLDDGVVGPKE
ncbi:MAG TPA: Gfo/Idh/MocA family oxidoreductase [Armatimonadota bacterium]|nr:Gfo/Idh/MocA family oxidoreductase [Armatimonadota bacterium]